MAEKTITVKIFSLLNGIEKYSDIKLIRIKSKDYNLLIMDDYLPIIGRVDGMIEFETAEKNKTLKNIQGYYIHKNNEFNLILKEN